MEEHPLDLVMHNNKRKTQRIKHKNNLIARHTRFRDFGNVDLNIKAKEDDMILQIPFENLTVYSDDTNLPLNFQNKPYESSFLCSTPVDPNYHCSGEINQNTSCNTWPEASKAYQEEYSYEEIVQTNVQENIQHHYSLTDSLSDNLEYVTPEVNCDSEIHDSYYNNNNNNSGNNDNENATGTLEDIRRRLSVRPRVPTRKIREQKELQGSSTSCTAMKKQRRPRTDYSAWSKEYRDAREMELKKEHSKGYRLRKKEKNMILEQDLNSLIEKNLNLKMQEKEKYINLKLGLRKLEKNDKTDATQKEILRIKQVLMNMAIDKMN